MKKILIPTDFSKTAIDAFNYAQSFISGKADLEVFHAYHPQIDPAYPYLGTPSEPFFKEKEKELEKWADTHYSSPGKKDGFENSMHTCLKIAAPTTAIVERSKEFDYIIMGMTGPTNVLDKLFGSVATFVARNAHCPVILVPMGYSFGGIKKVLYASNLASFDELMLPTNRLLMAYTPEIHLVHIQDAADGDYKVVSEDVEQLFRKNAPNMGIRFVKVESSDSVKGLQKYANDHQIDQVVVATPHRRWMEEVFHRSFTKRMVPSSQVPLLVMHPGDQEEEG